MSDKSDEDLLRSQGFYGTSGGQGVNHSGTISASFDSALGRKIMSEGGKDMAGTDEICELLDSILSSLDRAEESIREMNFGKARVYISDTKPTLHVLRKILLRKE